MNFFLIYLLSNFIIQPLVIVKDIFSSTINAPQIDALAKGEKILLIGDSLGEGMSNTFRKLAKRHGYLPVVDCLRGSNTNYWSKKVEKVISQNKPSLMIVSLGTNDSVTNDPETHRRHIKNIKFIAVKNNIRILWILPPQLPVKFHNQEKIKNLILEELKDRTFNTTIQIEKTSDRIHPTRKGYETWMNLIWQHLCKEGSLN